MILYEGITNGVNTNSMSSVSVQIDDHDMKKYGKDAMWSLAQNNVSNENWYRSCG